MHTNAPEPLFGLSRRGIRASAALPALNAVQIAEILARDYLQAKSGNGAAQRRSAG